jgi:sec-independent protein translocase protein TatC
MRKWLRVIGRILTAPFRFLRWLIRAIFRWIKNLLRNIYLFFTLEPDDTPLTRTFEKATQSPTGFLQALLAHLAELRWHLVRISLALLITSIFAFSYTELLIDWLAHPAGGIDTLTAVDITETIGVALRVSLLAGFLISMPYIGFELLIFIAAGIHRRTRIQILFLIPVVTSLFAAGMLFAYYLMLPVAVPFLLSIFNIQSINRLESYVRFVMAVMFWLGVAFQFPLASFWFSAIGFLQPKMLLSRWRIAVVIIAIMAAVITPTPDPVNMMIVFIPLLGLYFLGIATSYIASRRRDTRKGAEA